jgi:hypothetical protein
MRVSIWSFVYEVATDFVSIDMSGSNDQSYQGRI